MDSETTVLAERDDLRVVGGYPGANATDVTMEDDRTVTLAPDPRDAGHEWFFYWNVTVESDAERTVDVSFDREVVGPWGPAVSRDRRTWSWLGSDAADDHRGFRYEFGAGERTAFAFSVPYVRADFERWWTSVEQHERVHRQTLTTTANGRPVPLVQIGDLTADTHVLGACRHHACESPASYALEGWLGALAADPPSEWCAHVVPLVDLDGVYRGDQGKSRLPHDHNRDYGRSNGALDDIEPLYPTTAAIKRYVRNIDGEVALALDFHSPYKWGDPHDRVFFACSPEDATAADRRFARFLDEACDRTDDAMAFAADAGFAEPGGRSAGTTFTAFLDRAGATSSRTLEVPYFGTEGNRATPDRWRGLGRATDRATRQFVAPIE